MNNEELNELWHIFHDIEDANLSVFMSNTLVSACFMHSKGEHEAAIKLLTSLFKCIGIYKRKNLAGKVLKFLSDNEAVLALNVPANLELHKVFKPSDN